jgi:hypothetical protein
MVSLQSVNVAVSLNPLYGTSARHTQTCVLWVTVRGNWLSVQGAEQGPKIARVPAVYLFNQRSALAFRIGRRFRVGQSGNPLANGGVETLRNIPADAIYTIVEGQGVKSTVKLLPPTPH